MTVLPRSAMHIRVGSASGLLYAWWRRQSLRGKLRMVAIMTVGAVVALPLMVLALLVVLAVSMLTLGAVVVSFLRGLLGSGLSQRRINGRAEGRENVRVVR